MDVIRILTQVHYIMPGFGCKPPFSFCLVNAVAATLRGDPRRHLGRNLRINRRGQPAVFYLHPYELDTEALRRPLPGEDGNGSFKTRRARWTQRLRRGTVERKLRRLLKDFEWTTIEEYR